MKLRFIARDPGAANIIAALIRAGVSPFDFDLWTLPKALSVFKRLNITCSMKNFSDSFSEIEIRNAWKEDPATLLVTGTSHYSAFESIFWDLARAQGGSSLALLDSWYNLEPRFRHSKPDYVGAIDKKQMEELEAIGFAKSQIIWSGHPYLSMLMKNKAQLQQNADIAENDSDAFKVLYVSESITKDVKSGSNAAYGFNEFEVFDLILEAATILAKKNQRISIMIKLHPYEDPTEFERKIANIPLLPGVEIHIGSSTSDPLDLVLWSDMVIGISSMLLIEASVLGKPILSLQPNLIREDTFILTSREYIPRLNTKKTILDALSKNFSSQTERDHLVKSAQRFLDTFSKTSTSVIEDWIKQHQ